MKFKTAFRLICFWVIVNFLFQNLDEHALGILTNGSFLKTESGLNTFGTVFYYRIVANSWAWFGSLRMWTPLKGADNLMGHPGSRKKVWGA